VTAKLTLKPPKLEKRPRNMRTGCEGGQAMKGDSIDVRRAWNDRLFGLGVSCTGGIPANCNDTTLGIYGFSDYASLAMSFTWCTNADCTTSEH
jgi:hypothetical protein